MLDRGKRVGFAIARRQVVLEIAERLQKAFSKTKVVPVCQGYTKDIYGAIIVMTTHQLYRYPNYFDLLIIDEPDAFPFKGNVVLQGICQKACKGVKVYLTATPDEELKKQVKEGKLEYLYLAKRPTGHDLCIPTVYYCGELEMYIRLALIVKKLYEMRKPILLFVPSIRQSEFLYYVLNLFIPCCRINSKSKDKDQTIKAFKNGKYDICISTTILERGITIPKVNVIVYHCDSPVFDEASLTQISGRVGRSIDCPDGYCYFLSSKRKSEIDDCITSLQRANNA